MVKDFSSSTGNTPQYANVRRPIAGGTNDGRRPHRYTYWRVGYGETAGYSVPFYIERAGEYHSKAAYLTGSIDHPEASQVYYHLGGEAIFERPKGISPVYSGNILIIPPGQIAYYRAPEGMKYHWLSLGSHWPAEWGERSARLLKLKYDLELEGRFVEIRELLILQKSGYPLRAIGVFYELMARIAELSLTLTVAQSPYPEPVRNAIVFLRERISEPYNAEATAAVANLSQSYMRALFEKWVGESPRRFHTRGRIEWAALLLREQDYTVSAAAQQVGFNDVRHFSRVFKRVTGMRPREYARAGDGLVSHSEEP